jgi:multidrug efflux pump
MKQINLSEWALRHQSMVLYLMIVFMVGGVISFFSLGRAEDPDFTFKVMVVRTLWPGANAQQVEQQLTERIEKKLAETPWVDVLRTASKPGESLTIVILKDYTPKTEVPEAWRQVRKKLDDIRHTLPAGVQGPFPNDEFGDVQIKIFALTSRDDKTGYTMGDLRREADKLARELRRVPDVKKIELIGVQDEKIYIDVSPARLAAMGLVPTQVFDALQRQNAVAPAGQVETETDRVRLRVTGPFDSVDAIRETMLAVGGRSFRLGDIARVTSRPRRSAAAAHALRRARRRRHRRGDGARRQCHRPRREPVENHGPPAAGPAGGHGRARGIRPAADRQDLAQPLRQHAGRGHDHRTCGVIPQPRLAHRHRGRTVDPAGAGDDLPRHEALRHRPAAHFLGRAGDRPGGLLVDDAIIAAEMMVVKMEQGWDRFKAATFAYTSTAFPMLTGTLITAAGFTPVGFAKSGAGEYTISIFQVVTISLLISWIVAVVFTPWLGYKLLDPVKLRAIAEKHGGDIYNSPFYRRFRALVVWCLRHRWLVIGATIAVFALSLVAFNKGVQKQFFPARQPTGDHDRHLAAAGRVAQGHRARSQARRGLAGQ